MGKFINIFDKSVFQDLILVDYKRKGYDSGSKLAINDIIKFGERDNNLVWFSFTRVVKFEPENIYEILVKINVGREIKNKYINENIDFEKALKMLTEEELISLGGGVFNKISLIISQITELEKSRPLISADTIHRLDINAFMDLTKNTK